MRFSLLFSILLASQSLAQADTPVALEIRLIDVPMTSAPSMTDPAILAKAINEAPADSSAELFVSSLQDFDAEVGGVIEWLSATQFDATELPGEVHGIIHPGGMPITTQTPTAYDTFEVGTSFSFIREKWDTAVSANQRDCLGLVDRSFPGGDPIPMPRFNSIRASSDDPIKFSEEWTVIGSGENPRDNTVLRLICARAISAIEVSLGREASDETQIRSLIEVFEIDPTSAVPVMNSITSASDHSAARNLVGDLVAANSAKVLTTHFITQPTGTIVRQVSGDEEIYPTEFDPPELPNYISGEFKSNGNHLGTNLSPTTFETKLCGPEIQLEATAFPDEQLIECSILYRNHHVDLLQQFGSHLARLYMPYFARHICKTLVIAKAGKPQLLALFTPPLRTSHLDVSKTSSALDAPTYAVNGGPRIAIFLTTTIQTTTP